MSEDVKVTICHRCRKQVAIISVRQDNHCRECFLRYVYSKIVRRMDAVRSVDMTQQKKILLPLSFGVSSTALLSALDQHLTNRAEKSGHRPYSISVLHIEDDSLPQPQIDAVKQLGRVRMRFPSHTYDSIRLSCAVRESGEALPGSWSDPIPNPDGLLRLLSTAAGSPTGAVDVKTRLRTDLIVAYAAHHGCDGIVWGDSTTRLAEKTISETAKGRGGDLPALLSEAPRVGLVSTDLFWAYPVREMLRKELVSYCELMTPSLTDLVLERFVPAALAARNSTIDDLVATYFDSVEKDYPSIVTNVVRTVGKLRFSDEGSLAT